MTEYTEQDEAQWQTHYAALADPQANVCAAEKHEALQLLQKKVAGCTLCSELARQRHKTVFGVGHPAPEICFIGEAPGADEDRQGEPFVGRAGQLLDRILQACNWTRQDVYIANILKCRPPNNRNPLPPEVNNCLPYLLKQLHIIQPRVVCALGAVAAKTLLNTEISIGKLRGRWHRWQGLPLLCTYHPAYLLRNPAQKRAVWEDMQMLMKFVKNKNSDG